jgi:hypothetical protein
MEDQQEYSLEELRTINEAFWQSDRLWLAEDPRLPCPRCGAAARIVLAGATFGSPAEIHASCHRCKAHGAVAAVERLAQDDLPPKAVEEIVDRHHSGLDSYCPNCHTLLTVKELGTFEGDSYLVLCPRCNVSGQAG